MIYDRCPECKRTMHFHAITVARGEWRRWVECVCGVYASAGPHGEEVYVGKSMPPKNILARNEVPEDE